MKVLGFLLSTGNAGGEVALNLLKNLSAVSGSALRV
jgi:hypothetical protein